MRYWWVNQNQTFRYEIAGGYLWSPKRNKGSRWNPFYETMREVARGDVPARFQAALDLIESNRRIIAINQALIHNCRIPSFEDGEAIRA